MFIIFGWNGGQSCKISALYRKRLRSNREKTVWGAQIPLDQRGSVVKKPTGPV